MTTANRFSALFKAPTKIASTDKKCSYTNDFPSLDEAKKVPTKIEGDLHKKDTLPTESRKQTQTKIILGHRSYEEELRSQEVSYNSEMPQKRVEAYELLANKEKLETSLAKTRMCNSIDKKEKCKHGDQCRFAHNLSELKISDCLFEDKCCFVKMCDSKLQNNGVKICNHKHPQESKEDFISRVGLDRYNKRKESLLSRPQQQFVPRPQQFVPPPQQQFVPPPPPQQQFVPPPQQQFVPPPPPQQQQFVPPQQQFVPPPQQQFVPPPPPQQQFVPPPAPSTEQILIIRVPKELASQALEIAMKNGRMNIQVEII